MEEVVAHHSFTPSPEVQRKVPFYSLKGDSRSAGVGRPAAVVTFVLLI